MNFLSKTAAIATIIGTLVTVFAYYSDNNDDDSPLDQSIDLPITD